MSGCISKVSVRFEKAAGDAEGWKPGDLRRRTGADYETVRRDFEAIAKKISWLEAAEIIAVGDRTVRRMRQQCVEYGFNGLFDQRCQVVRRRSGVPIAGSGRGDPCRACCCAPIAASIAGSPRIAIRLMVILDNATSEIYYAQLLEEKSTPTVMTELREIIETKGRFCALYSDRSSHFLSLERQERKSIRIAPRSIDQSKSEVKSGKAPAHKRVLMKFTLRRLAPLAINIYFALDQLFAAGNLHPAKAVFKAGPYPELEARETALESASAKRGRVQFGQTCGFCHGVDATGGAEGPNLMRSSLVRHDESGNYIGQVIREGRPTKGMPPQHLSESQIADVVAFLRWRLSEVDKRSPDDPRERDLKILLTGASAKGRHFLMVRATALVAILRQAILPALLLNFPQPISRPVFSIHQRFPRLQR